MQIQKINGAQSFKGLDFDNVSATDKNLYIRGNLKGLNRLGQKCDIKLTSCYSDVPDFSAIQIEVKPLKDGLGFFKRLFRPYVQSMFKTGYVHISDKLKTKEDFLIAVDEAVSKLGKKVTLHK